MESLLDTSKTMPVGGQKLVDPKRLKELMDQLVLVIPQEVDAARQLLDNKDNLIQQAQSEAKRRRSEAEEEFRSRVDQNEIVAAAQAKAEAIEEETQKKVAQKLEQADREALNKRAEAYDYALQVLKGLEQQLDGLLGTVKNGVGMLAPSAESVSAGNNNNH